MDNGKDLGVWGMRAAYLGLALVILLVSLLPLQTAPRSWAAPDLLVAVTLAWALRRPDYTPIALIALVMLTADILLHRPPGLWALLVVLAAENLRSRFAGLGEASFTGEWVAVGLALAAITVAYRAILSLMLVDQAPVGLAVVQCLATIAIYPVVVLISQGLLGIQRLAPSDAEAAGIRS